jgi:hypothetical protein
LPDASTPQIFVEDPAETCVMVVLMEVPPSLTISCSFL